MIKRALISVSDKTGIREFANELLKLGVQVISTGGTYEHIKADGVVKVEDVTGFPEILDGRVKTLHPKIHGGILAKRDENKHMEALGSFDIGEIDLVVVNLYPFGEVLANAASTNEKIIENIDIGGPALLRSAAKNHAFVTVVVDSRDYGVVLEELARGGVFLETRKRLAAKAFRHTAEYDTLIADFMNDGDFLRPAETSGVRHKNTDSPTLVSSSGNLLVHGFPEKLVLSYELAQPLRYGENPHQKAAVYKSVFSSDSFSPRLSVPGQTQKTGILKAKQLQGKELSYNNIADGDMAIKLASEFDEPVCVVVKHQNPCGVGVGETVSEAFKKAYEADPVSIFGGIVAFNREVDGETAKLMGPIVLDVILAPSFSEDAFKILTKKKNTRLLEIASLGYNDTKTFTSIEGGLLVQDADMHGFKDAVLTVPTKKQPTPEQISAAEFAWKVVKYVKSNGILLAKDGKTLGIGSGQTNRVGSAKIAIGQAGQEAEGAVLASDAMIPFPDTVELAAKAGVGVIIQTGGSVKDSEVIAECDKHGIAMILTGIRHFRH